MTFTSIVGDLAGKSTDPLLDLPEPVCDAVRKLVSLLLTCVSLCLTL